MRIAAAFAGATALSFVLNVISGLRYTRVSADILFDMRLEMYRHLQRMSPRFYAHLRMGDIMSRINNDISEIQRVAAETALAWVGNGLFLVGTTVMLAWLDLRLFLLTAATAPLAMVAWSSTARRLEKEITVLRERSADIGSFLIETLQAMKLIVTSNAEQREAERFGEKNRAFIRALMSMQWLSYLSGGLPGPRAVRRYGRGVRVWRPSRDRRNADRRHLHRVHGVQDALHAVARSAHGAIRQRGHCARLVAARLRGARYVRRGRGAC